MPPSTIAARPRVSDVEVEVQCLQCSRLAERLGGTLKQQINLTSPCASAGQTLHARTDAAHSRLSRDTVLALDHARAVGVARLLGRTGLVPERLDTPVRSEQGAMTWGAHPALGTHTAKLGSSPPAVHSTKPQYTPTHDLVGHRKSHEMPLI